MARSTTSFEQHLYKFSKKRDKRERVRKKGVEEEEEEEEEERGIRAAQEMTEEKQMGENLLLNALLVGKGSHNMATASNRVHGRCTAELRLRKRD